MVVERWGMRWWLRSISGRTVVQVVLGEVNERRLAALSARELHDVADAGARELVAW